MNAVFAWFNGGEFSSYDNRKNSFMSRTEKTKGLKEKVNIVSHTISLPDQDRHNGYSLLFNKEFLPRFIQFRLSPVQLFLVFRVCQYKKGGRVYLFRTKTNDFLTSPTGEEDFDLKKVSDIKELMIVSQFFLQINHEGVKPANVCESLGNVSINERAVNRIVQMSFRFTLFKTFLIQGSKISLMIHEPSLRTLFTFLLFTTALAGGEDETIEEEGSS